MNRYRPICPSLRLLLAYCLVIVFLLGAPCTFAQSDVSLRLEVTLVSDEADAALAILALRAAGQPVPDADWERLFTSEGYLRLKKRELSLQRPFDDDSFRAFVLSDQLAARAAALRETLARWKGADLTGAAARALAYLPASARLRARIYPVIKPRDNSFVFETDSNPAIFLFLDPQMTSAQFENTLAHELHHIGLTSACVSVASADQPKFPKAVQTVRDWISAFGEGVAMLAASGDPDVHPHAASAAEDRARWDRDVANFNEDLHKVEAFFLAVLDHHLTSEDEIRKQAFSFFGVQGPWYTVGWRMAVTIEKSYGRQRLIACLCDPTQFLATYNAAASKVAAAGGPSLARWSPALLERIAIPGAVPAAGVRKP